jgi:hypothetical protein
MPRNVYSEINLHFAWHTKDSTPVLGSSIEKHLHGFLRERSRHPGYTSTQLEALRITYTWS